jgi:putative FmdB family regulatory protein
MPIYEYKCKTCGVIEHLQLKKEDELKVCPTCNEPVEKLISPCNSHFQGPGFYKTDYAPTKKPTKE